MFCRNCGNEIKENEKFCGKCGAKIDNNLANENTIANADEDKTNVKKPIKIKFTYVVIGIIVILFLLAGVIAYINGSKSVLTSASKVARDYQNTNTTISKDTPQNNNTDLPIYIGKTYVGEHNDLTYYLTFLSGGEIKYVAKYNYGLLEDTVLKGKYEIDGKTIKVTIKIGAISTETFTIIDKNTIKSGSTTYTVRDY